MRIVLCDPHPTFSESFAHVLTLRGAKVVAIVQRVAEVAVVLGRQTVDVCVVGLGSDTSLSDERYVGLGSVTPQVPVVLLAATVTPGLRAESSALAVRGLGEMAQGMSEILGLLDRVRQGDAVLDVAGSAPRHTTAAAPAVGDPAVRRTAGALSARERAVLAALVRGEDTGALARNLGISRTTARGHIQSVLFKLGVHSRVAAVSLAVRGGLVNPRTGQWREL